MLQDNDDMVDDEYGAGNGDTSEDDKGEDGTSKSRFSSSLTVNLGSTDDQSNIKLPTKSFGQSVTTWCIDILTSLERLLDAPTFVAILQVS